jgi:hypothetical protein
MEAQVIVHCVFYNHYVRIGIMKAQLKLNSGRMFNAVPVMLQVSGSSKLLIMHLSIEYFTLSAFNNGS